MSGRHLLDTNVVIALFSGDRGVQARLTTASEVFLPSVTLGELYFGAAHSTRKEANTARVDSFAASLTVVGVDAETARRYGRLKAELRKKGRPIPENDLWIAACAVQHGLSLASRDPHFDAVEGLQVEVW
jgi:tRNA(fMet)-specific endonuclease VapC